MSKEAQRVIKQIQTNNLPNIVARVKVNNIKEFSTCLSKIRIACPDTVIMIIADKPITKKQKDKVLWVGANVPERVAEQLEGWMDDSTKHIVADGKITEHLDENTYSIVSIEYPTTSESIPFKLVDVVNGTAFSILKKRGIQEDESSSEEYGFDDIEE